MSIKIASMNFGDCDTILHNTPNGMKNIAEVLGPNGEVYWSATKELTGVPPLSIRSNGMMLLDYLIGGNMEQSGTPTPTTPIQPQETGERTENLWDSNYENGLINTEGTLNASSDNYNTTMYIPIERENYTLSVICNYDLGLRLLRVCFYDENKNFISYVNSPAFQGKDFFYEFNFTAPVNSKYLRFSYIFRAGMSDTNIMLNTGSTALPFEPSGIKIPISSGGENLFDWNWLVDGKSVFLDGSVVDDLNRTTTMNAIPVTASGYTLNYTSSEVKFISATYNNGTLINRVIHDSVPDIIDTTGANELRVTLFKTGVQVKKSDISNIMLNRGSTAIPYEPYNRTTTPVYLGEVPTTRRIGKLALTGDETVTEYTGYGAEHCFFVKSKTLSGIGYCNIYTNVNELGIWIATDNSFQLAQASYIRIHDGRFSIASELKSYLAAQYAAGTPVTIWYVLATPETGTVNEPLRKIGDYADTLSMEQAGVQIPTVKGNTVIDVETTLKPSQMYIKYK